jgi:hypothetical protein
MIEQLAKKKKFSLKTPIDQLSETALNLVLFGNEEGLDAESAELDKDDYPGVVNMVVKWFTDSSSDNIREWAEKYMMLKPCTTCNGARLKQESLWFKIDETNIAELSDMDLNQLHDWFNDLEKRIDKKQNAIANFVGEMIEAAQNENCKDEKCTVLSTLYTEVSGEIKTIRNHEIRKDIVLLIDWWEHSFNIDFRADKKAYLTNQWKIINWDTINQRI